MIDINNLWAKSRPQIPSVYDDSLSYLESIDRLRGGVVKIAEQSNENKENLNKKVSFEDMQNIYKLSNNADFTGSWFGIKKPTASNEGLAATVDLIKDETIPNIYNEINNTNSSLEQIESSFISVTSLGCTVNEENATNNVIYIQNAINNGIDLNFNILVPINDTIKIPLSYNNHKLNFENRFTTGLLMIVDNKPILETVEYGIKNIVINELGLQYKRPQLVGCEKSIALYFNLETDISRGFYGWYINGAYIKNSYSGISKSNINSSVIWGCYFKDIQIEDVYGKPIYLVGINAGQLDNVLDGIKIYNYNIVDLGYGDIRNDGNSAIEISGECKLDGIDIENWQLTNNKPLINVDRVNGRIKNIHLERIHFKNYTCDILYCTNSQVDIDVINMSNSYYYETCNEVNILNLKSDIFGNSNCKIRLNNVVIKDKKQNSNVTKKYIVKQNNVLPCFANIDNFVQYQTDNNWLINNPSQSNDVFKNVIFEGRKIGLTQLPTLGTWNKGEEFILNNKTCMVEKSGTLRTITQHYCNTITGSNIISIVGNMQSYAFYVDEYVTINEEDFKIIERGNNQLTLDKTCGSTLQNIQINYTNPEFTQYKRIDDLLQNSTGFIKYMREGNLINIKGEIVLNTPQSSNNVKLFDLPYYLQSNESTFTSGETIVINMCSSSGGSFGTIPILIKNNSILAHCGVRGTLTDVKKINLNITYMISQI